MLLPTMAQTNTSDADIKHLVQQSYNNIANTYATWTLSRPSTRIAYTDKLLSLLSDTPKAGGAKVLELGCGPGVPISQRLCQSDKVASVLGVDISGSMIRLARERCGGNGKAEFIEADMTTLSFPSGTLDGVVAFFSLFHLPRVELPAMLQHVYTWLRPGGVLACNFATMESDTRHRWDYFQTEMFWSGVGVDGTLKMVKEAGLELLETEVLDGGGGVKGDADYGVKFLWVLARNTGQGDGGG